MGGTSQDAQTGAVNAASPPPDGAGPSTTRQPPATNTSPIKGPKGPSKQPKKNLTGSDPPTRPRGPGGGSTLAGRPRSPQNPDPNPHTTTQTPDDQKQGQIVTRSDIAYIPSSTTVNRLIRGDLILPDSIDESELYNSIEIYNEMLLDPTIAGVRLWMNVNVLSDGLTFEAREFEEPPEQQKDDTAETTKAKTARNATYQVDQQEADWSRRYVKEAIDRLEFTDRHILNICWDLLDGARIPHKLAEATFDTQRYGEFAGLPGLRSLKPKPRINYNLVYDTFNTFRGIVAIVPGGSLARWAGFIFDVSVLPNAIAAEKLVIFMADDRDGIPRSLYNAIYAPWMRMLSLYFDMMQTSRASAGGKRAVVLADKAGQVFTSNTGEGTATGEENALAACENWNNEGTLVLAHGSTPYVFYPQGTALNAYIEAIKMCKNEIATALTTNAKAIFEGEHGSGLSEDNASDDAQPVVDMLKDKLCRALNGLSYNLLKLAKGEEYAVRYCPLASMKRGDVVDFPAAGTAWAAIAAAEGFTPSQWPDVAKLIGVRVPNQMEMEELGKTWIAKQYQTQNPPEPAPVAGAPAKPAAKSG